MKINERLAADTILIKDLELCELRLLKDELDWFVLVPKRESITEIYELDKKDQAVLLDEINFVSLKLKEIGNPDKINIGAIGNVVSQLHIHIIGRFKTDRAWPNTIWGTESTAKFDMEKVEFWSKNFNPSI